MSFQIVTISQWFNSVNGKRQPPLPLPIVDLRSSSEYSTKRITSAYKQNVKTTVVNLPIESLLSGERSCELPPRNVPFAILVPKQEYCRVDIQQKHQLKISPENSPKLSDRTPSSAPAINKGIFDTSIGDSDIIIEKKIQNFFEATQSKITQQSRCKWNVQEVLLESELLWKSAEELGLIHINREESCDSNNFTSKMSSETVEKSQRALHSRPEKFSPLPRLWRPDPLVHSHLLPLLFNLIKDRIGEYSSEKLTSERNNISIQVRKNLPSLDEISGSTLEVWDFGSGAGRDVCFLAEECLAFFHKQCIDNHIQPCLQSSLKKFKENDLPLPTLAPFSPHFPIKFVGIDNHKGSAKRCIPLWRNRHVSEITDTKLLDLKKIELLHSEFCSHNDINCENSHILNDSEKASTGKKRKLALRNCNVFLCYAIRYLNRNLLKYLVSDKCPLGTGSIFAMSHFCKPTDDADWNFDHPKVKSVLERNELRKLFCHGDNEWEILQDEICLDGDHGRTLIQFVARKT